MTGIRRLAAIMAVDVVGYSSLMGEDEAGTATAVREHRDAARPLVASRGGRIVKTMGDGLLLEFPSIVDAVECAIAIQKLMAERNKESPEAKRIVYRVGVNLGDVLVEGEDIVGDGVNIAARLEGICEPGGVLMSGAAHEHVRGRIDAGFVDLGETMLKNIARPVRVYSVANGLENAALAPSITAAEPKGPPRLSMVVLPFANMGGDAEHEYFVDGVTESLTTDLSRIRGSFVIGRNTAFTYKGKAVDLKRIGRELNVRYVLEGSVQRSGNRMRVNVQLLDAESGSHLWAERFDKAIVDLFDMQDEIVARLAAELNVELIVAEARRAQRCANPDSMDLCFQGAAWLNRGMDAGNVARARDIFIRALASDPDNVDALIGSAATDAISGASGFAADPWATFAAAEAKLVKALYLAPGDARSHVTLGYIYVYTRRVAEGIAAGQHALTLNQNLGSAHSLIGYGKLFSGREYETEAHIAEALRLSPRDSHSYVWLAYAGMAKFGPGNYEDAASRLRRSLEVNRNFPHAHFFLSGALALLGRLDEARAAVAAGLALNPTYSIARDRAVWAAVSDNPTFLASLDLVYDGMRKAGIPEN